MRQVPYLFREFPRLQGPTLYSGAKGADLEFHMLIEQMENVRHDYTIQVTYKPSDLIISKVHHE